MSTLTPEQAQIISMEREWYRYPGVKEDAVRERFGMSMTRYAQVLNALLDDINALAYDPQTIRRLRRLRDARRMARTGSS